MDSAHLQVLACDCTARLQLASGLVVIGDTRRGRPTEQGWCELPAAGSDGPWAADTSVLLDVLFFSYSRNWHVLKQSEQSGLSDACKPFHCGKFGLLTTQQHSKSERS